MTQLELQVRIDKKQEQINKTERLIKKYESKLTAEQIELSHRSDINYRELREIIRNSNYEYSVGTTIEDIRRKKFNLKEYRETLNKYQTQLDMVINFEKETKIEVFVKFLDQWEQNVLAWFKNNINKYNELQANFEEKRNEWINKYYPNLEEINYLARNTIKREFSENYFREIHSLTKNYHNQFHIIEEQIAKDKTSKYKSLVSKVTKITGEIKDASYLSISDNGEINGLVTGEKGKADVTTITAGGYNIQCFHYRVLVKKVK